MIKSGRICLMLTTAMVTVGGGAFAQNGDSSPAVEERRGVDTVLVTAQRKEETLQEVPISVNVVSGDNLVERGVTLTTDLPNLVPGLTFATTGPGGTAFLRGVGSNAGNPNDEPSVATYVDGVYIAESSANRMGLANIERVEVLKGPQGTRFGRNATGGVIQIITKKPQKEPTLEASVGYGKYQTVVGSVYATAGISDAIAADIAFNISDQNKGWGYNPVRDEETYLSSTLGVRSQLLIAPNDDLSVLFAGDYQKLDSNIVDYRLPPGVVGIDGVPQNQGLYDTVGAIVALPGVDDTPFVSVEQYGGSAKVNWNLGFGEFVSITSYREAKGDYYPETDATTLPVVEGVLPRFSEAFTQEVQLLSTDDSVLDWALGIYYISFDAGYDDGTLTGLAFGMPPFSAIGTFQEHAVQETDSIAGYAQLTYEVLPGLEFTAGGRYTDESQKNITTVVGLGALPVVTQGFERFTWRFAMNYELAQNVNAYASYNRGVKGGGFDLLTPGSAGYAPEILDAYEVGFKSVLFDNMLRFNAAMFYNDFQNIQVQIIPSGSGGLVVTTNAAAATIKGLEADFEFVPTNNFSLSGGFSVLDGEYDDFQDTVSYPPSPLDGLPLVIDASGNDTIRTPDFTGNLTARYDVESNFGLFPITATVSHNSGFFFGQDNRLAQDAYTLLSASVGWVDSSNRYSVTVWGNNLTDAYYLQQAVPSALGDLTTPAAPRTFGVTLKAKFGG